MFANPLRRNANAVKASEARKWRARLHSTFPLLSQAQLEEAWPSSTSLVVQRVAPAMAPVQQVFFADKTPLFFTTSEGKGNDVAVLPSLYLLRAAPQIMPVVRVYAGVGKKLCGGADLFMPGVVLTDAVEPGRSWVKDNFGDFDKGAIWAVVEEGEWFPVGLAAWTVSSSDLEYQGTVGRGMRMVHTRGDCLWELGDQGLPVATEVPASVREAIEGLQAEQAEQAAAERAARREAAAQEAEEQRLRDLDELPKAIKRKQKVLRQVETLRSRVDAGEVSPDKDQQDKISRLGDLQDEIAELEQRLATAQLGPAPPPTDDDQQDDDTEAAADNDGNDDHEQAQVAAAQQTEAEEGGGTGKGEGGQEAHGEVGGEADGGDDSEGDDNPRAEPDGGDNQEDDGPPAAAMDDVLLNATLLALKTTLAAKDALPLLVSSAYAQHILPASRQLRLEGFVVPELNVKQTSWKKIGTFLSDLASRGVIGLATEGKGVQKITVRYSDHEELASFDVEAHTAPPQDDQAAATGSSSGLTKPPLWTMPKSGSQKIMVQIKKVRGNKNITTITNLTPFGIKLDDDFRKELAKRFSGAVSFAPGPDAKQGPVVTVQGKYATQIADFLQQRYNFPKKTIVVNDKGMSKLDRAVKV